MGKKGHLWMIRSFCGLESRSTTSKVPENLDPMALHLSDGFKNVPLSPHCCLSRGFPSPSKFLRKSLPNHQQIQV